MARRKLTPEQKAEADAQMQHRLNLMRIQRVYSGAQRSSWYEFPSEAYDQWEENGCLSTEGDAMILTVAADGLYRIHSYDGDREVWVARKTETFPVQETEGCTSQDTVIG